VPSLHPLHFNLMCAHRPALFGTAQRHAGGVGASEPGEPEAARRSRVGNRGGEGLDASVRRHLLFRLFISSRMHAHTHALVATPATAAICGRCKNGGIASRRIASDSLPEKEG
jgi:hypothetical protein